MIKQSLEIYDLGGLIRKELDYNATFPNLFFLTTCHIKTRPYLGKLYLVK